MTKNIAIASALAVLFIAGAANAASITNLDSKDHKISVIEGDKITDYDVKPSQMVEGLCPQGCIVRLNSDENNEFEFEAEDVVVIDEGQLYLDPQTPAQGDGSTDLPPEELQERN